MKGIKFSIYNVNILLSLYANNQWKNLPIIYFEHNETFLHAVDISWSRYF